MNFAQLSKDALIDSKSKKYTEVTINDEFPIDYDINENPEIKQTYDYIKQNSPVIFLIGGKLRYLVNTKILQV